MKKNLLLIFLTLILFSSCITGPKIETLFVGEGIMQYFIYPTTLKNENSKVNIDITYRRFKGKEGFVTVNFSFNYQDLILSDLKSAGFILGEKFYNLVDIKILFQEKRNRLIRYTSQMNETDFLEVIKAADSLFFIDTIKAKSMYPATSELKEKFKELSFELF